MSSEPAADAVLIRAATSVQAKIIAASLGFVAIIAVLGGLARHQVGEMGRLAMGIYDHAFMGMSYVDQTQEEFLRFSARHGHDGATLADGPGRADLQRVVDRIDVAMERASSERTREAGRQARAALIALTVAPADALSGQMDKVDKAIAKLVKKFSSDGLETRDAADELATGSARLVLMEIAAAIVVALAIGWVVGRNLSRPLVQLVRTIDRLTAGDLDADIPSRLMRRRDEVGALARATAVFRDAMRQNARAEGEAARDRAAAEADKRAALLQAADSIERETTQVATKSLETSSTLTDRAQDLADSASRVLRSVGSVSSASANALHRSEEVVAAGERLSASAREIANQINRTAAEIGNTARDGERARHIIGELSDAVAQIGVMARLIGDIAGRTNLLALNATIEAARAGEAGRGFAVVANEVKALASQTARSTQEIARNAGAIQQATQCAVEVVGEIVERVAAIEHITRDVAGAVEQQTSATGDIARNVAETADAIRFVATQIALVSREAEGTDAAVTEMRGLAGSVGERISELRGVMVRIVRGSSPDADRRDSERIESDIAATLDVDGGGQPAQCLNLGRGGAEVRLGAGRSGLARRGGRGREQMPHPLRLRA
jgi:methyl-accepting chemotaxis protein